MSHSSRNCTILIATHNRPQMLAQQLRYFESAAFAGPVRILDSSDKELAAQNAAIAALYPRFVYECLPPSTPVFSKFAKALCDSDTLYSVLVPDDDFLLVERLPEIVAAIEERPDVAVAHGYYFEYAVCGDAVRMTALIQTGTHLDQVSSVDRVVALMGHYEALTYAVCRTEQARIAFAHAATQGSILAQELLAGAAMAVQGKVLRLGFLSHGRRAGSTLGYSRWHPMEWTAVDPESFFAAYAPYRTALLNIIASHAPDTDMAKAARSIDLGHLAYLSRYLDSDVLTNAAASDIAGLGAEGVVEAAWDVWAASRGPAWLRPLRTGNRVSRSLRRMVRRMGLRYRLPNWHTGIDRRFLTHGTGSITNVRITPSLSDDLALLGSLADAEPDIGRLARALAIRASVSGEPVSA